MSPAQIEELLKGGSRYELSIKEPLEKHVLAQLKEGHYDFDANLAVLKLYLLYPEESNQEIIEGILLKALMAFPKSDFCLCMYQIPEKYNKEFSGIKGLAQQLEMAKFKAFWKEAESVEALSKAKGWQAAVRSFIAGVVSSTFRSIRQEQLIELLNITAKELDAMITERGWTRSKEDKQVVTVNTSTFESIAKAVEKPKEPTNMTMDQYRQLFTASATLA